MECAGGSSTAFVYFRFEQWWGDSASSIFQPMPWPCLPNLTHSPLASEILDEMLRHTHSSHAVFTVDSMGSNLARSRRREKTEHKRS